MQAEQLQALLEQWQTSVWLPVVIVGGFILGSLIFVPITAMILATAYLLPPFQTAICSISGVVLGGLSGFMLGKTLGERTLKRISRTVFDKVKRRLKGNELLSVAIIRKLPIAPFSVVNMAIGAVGIRARYFVAGTILGMAPLIILVSVLDSSLEAVDSDSSPGTYWLAIPVWLGTLALAIALQRYIDRQK